MVESNKENQVLLLKDGRKLGFAECGDLSGKAIFHFHGHPGSRIEIKLFGEKPQKHGVHLITVDRPGIGLSDFKTDRILLDWPDDIVELADHLGLEKFAVEGISGGAPYAAVCAYKIPERLTCCGIVGGLGKINWSKKGMMRSNRIGSFISRRLPFLIKPLMKSSKKAFEDPESLNKFAKSLPEPDKKLFEDPEILEIFMEDYKEAFRSGVDGAVHEERIYAKPWGFNLEDISPNLPVFVWHGEKDVFVLCSHGRKMCELIPNSKGFFYPDEGHLSVGYNNLDEIFETLKL